MKQRIVALLLIAFVVVLAGTTTAIAGGRQEGTRTRECQTDQWGTWCQTIWTSNDGVVERGHWTYESSDGSTSGKGRWRTNYEKGTSWGESFWTWFYSWLGGGKG